MEPGAQRLFAGTFERSIDAKKRVAIPSAWLEKKEGERFYVLPHPGGEFLMVMPPEELRGWVQRFESSGKAPAAQREAMRAFFGDARDVVTDTQGRILLPEEYCEALGLRGVVAFVGGSSRFEIWEKEQYAARAAKARATYLEVAEAIGL
jgi:MraZ protein